MRIFYFFTIFFVVSLIPLIAVEEEYDTELLLLDMVKEYPLIESVERIDHTCVQQDIPKSMPLQVVGKAKPYTPPVKKDHPGKTERRHDNIQNPEDWRLLDSIMFDSYIPPKANFGVKLNREKQKLELTSPFSLLTQEAKNAALKAPAWLRSQLILTFSKISQTKQKSLAAVIINAVDPYIDETAFAIAWSSPAFLNSNYCNPQMFEDNAKLIYKNDSALKYVEVVDYGDSQTDENFYSTVSYKRIDSDSLMQTVEIPRDIYYFYIVHPKLSDEISAYVNPEIFEHNPDYSNHTLNIKNPPEGVLWRDYLFNHTEPVPDTTGVDFPILKDEAAKCDVVWNDLDDKAPQAIRTITKWVNDVMNFTSQSERPHQPVRIYDIHIGRCGEHEDITNAASRSCLIPCRGISTISTDHVWNEFWDLDWQQWEPVNNSHRNKMCYGEEGWGKKFGTVYSRRSDGMIEMVTDQYSHLTSKVTVYAFDKNNKPIDGAVIVMYVSDLTDPNSIYYDSYQVADNEGKTTFILGNQRQYFIRLMSDVGNVPEAQNQVSALVEYPEKDREYTFSINTSKEKVPANFTPLTEVYDPTGDFKLGVNFTVDRQAITWWNLIDDMSAMYTYPAFANGDINFFFSDEKNYNNSSSNVNFSSLDPKEKISNGDFEISYPDTATWFAYFNNRNCTRNYVHVKGQFKLYASSLVSVPEEQMAVSEASCFPNPFSANLNINFSLKAGSNVKVEIFNNQGTLVKQLVNSAMETGSHNIIWNGTNSDNIPLPSGIYFYKLTAGGKIQSGTVSLVR